MVWSSKLFTQHHTDTLSAANELENPDDESLRRRSPPLHHHLALWQSLAALIRLLENWTRDLMRVFSGTKAQRTECISDQWAENYNLPLDDITAEVMFVNTDKELKILRFSPYNTFYKVGVVEGAQCTYFYDVQFKTGSVFNNKTEGST